MMLMQDLSLTGWVRQLGAALASLSNLLDISTFIIGGGVAGFGKPLFDSTRITISKEYCYLCVQRVLVIPANLKMMLEFKVHRRWCFIIIRLIRQNLLCI